MATSDSEAFESADEDFEFDQHTSVQLPGKLSEGSCRPSDTQISVGDVAVEAADEKKADSQSVIAENYPLEDSSKSLDIDRIKLQDRDHSRGFQSGNKSTSSDSDGDDSVRTLKGESNFKQGSEGVAVTDLEPKNESSELKDNPVSSVVGTDNSKVKIDSEVDCVKDKVRNNPLSRKHERKRPQAVKDGKQASRIKKLGTRITPKTINSNKESLNVEDEQTKNEEKLLHSPDGVATGNITTNIGSEEYDSKIGSALEKLTEATQKKASGGWGGWGNWGVTSILTTATESVSSLTNQVTHGFSSVLETGIGIPDPEELARLDKERELVPDKRNSNDGSNISNSTVDVTDEQKEQRVQSALDDKTMEAHPQDGTGLFGISRVFSGVSSITKLVESTGSKVITGGLDTLETIGKKTMEVLQEGDPGLRKKREIFSDKIILSQILREAKEKAEMEDKLNEDKEAMRKAHFETLFDDYQGLVHLEALEMLSKQCELKMETILQSLTGQVAVELHDKIAALKEICDIPDDEDDAGQKEEENMSDAWLNTLSESSNDLGVNVCIDKIAEVWTDTKFWFSNPKSEISHQEIHQKAISSLARFTAASVEHFHKTAELLLVKEDRDPFQEAHCLQEMTLLLSAHVDILAGKFSDILSSQNDENSAASFVSNIITNIFFEASNSSSYLKEAFQLVIPVLQLGMKP